MDPPFPGFAFSNREAAQEFRQMWPPRPSPLPCPGLTRHPESVDTFWIAGSSPTMTAKGRATLDPQRAAILAGVGARDQDAAFVIDQDRLAAAQRFAPDRDRVTTAGEVCRHRLADRRLEL